MDIDTLLDSLPRDTATGVARPANIAGYNNHSTRRSIDALYAFNTRNRHKAWNI